MRIRKPAWRSSRKPSNQPSASVPELDEQSLLAVLRVIDAWDVPGPSVSAHNDARSWVYNNWPTLYWAMINMVDRVDQEASKRRIRRLVQEFGKDLYADQES